MREDSFLEPWWSALEGELGATQPLDAHTHTGHTDPDGFHATPAEIAEGVERIGGRAVIFPFHCGDGYARENDRVLAEAAASGGRLIAFCRVNPRTDDAVAEAERSLDAGAAGIKLHPRAESFVLADRELRGLFAMADERRLPVLVHAGRGIPALGEHAVQVCREFPGLRLILAHAGISDLAWLWRDAASLPNLFFDTSWWSAADLVALFTLVPPGQVLFASDAPYGTPLLGALLTVRCALAAGLSGEQLALVMGGQAERLLARAEPVDAGPAPGVRDAPRDVLLDRAATFLDSAVGRIFVGDGAFEPVQLAGLASDVPDDDPHAAAFASIRRLCEDYPRARAEVDGRYQFPGGHLLILAACIARTPDVALP